MTYYLISYLQIWRDGYTCAFNTAVDETPFAFLNWFYDFQKSLEFKQQKDIVLLNSCKITKKEYDSFHNSNINKNGIQWPNRLTHR